MWKLKKRGRCARNKFFYSFLLLCMHSGRVFIRCTMWTWLSISERNFLPSIRSFVRSFIHSLACSLVPYLLPRQRKMRASHLHVKSDKTSARFTTQVMRHFSHFATHPRYTIFSSEMQNCFIFIEKFSDNLLTFLFCI